jgi:hypothetical protein
MIKEDEKMNALKSQDIDVVMADVEPQHYFVTKDGRQIKNMRELAEVLEKMNEDVFTYHVNAQKNDFSNWLKDVIRDEELAKEIAGRSKAETASKISSKVARLNKIKENLQRIEEHEKKAYEELQKTIRSKERNPIQDYVYGIIIGTITGLMLGTLL